MVPVFYYGVAHKVILQVSDNEVNISKIMRKIKGTYSHVIKIIPILEEKGFLKSKKSGRERLVTLTEKGKKLKKYLIKVQSLI